MQRYLLLFLFCTTSVFANTTITLSETAMTTQSYIRFAEVVSVTGDNAVVINNAFLAPAPASDEQIIVTRQDIMRRLQVLGLASDVTFRGSERVAIANGNSAARQIATSLITDHKNHNANEKNIRKTSASMPLRTSSGNNNNNAPQNPQRDNAIRLAVDDLIKREFNGYQVRTQINLRTVNLISENIARVEATSIRDGRLPGRAEIALTTYNEKNELLGYGTAEILSTIEISMPVLTRSLNKGDTIRDSDIAMQYEIFNGARPEKFSLDEINGHQSLRQLRAGSKIALADFNPPQDTKKGSVLTVIVKGDGFTIKERAIAQSDGRIGDSIKVQAEISKNIYTVRIAGNGVADIGGK